MHECEWETTDGGGMRLARARVRLDWGQWIGLKPRGLVNSTVLDLFKKPGWKTLQADDLRRMAAGAMRVPFEEVRFFYGDEDLKIDSHGLATIRHNKDAFYILDDGTFQSDAGLVRFMACMGAMHWDSIDFLPVVELFQSLLPGTGSAVFELIRGLYDDQNEAVPQPRSLRYRGIPTYPSDAAFRLFSGFFVPRAPGGQKPYPLFLDPAHAHEVTWLPASDPPRRYFDIARKLCITVKGDTMMKATLADDPTGLAFINADRTGFAPCERSLGISRGVVLLKEGRKQMDIPASPTWGHLRDMAPHTPPLSAESGPSQLWPYPMSWREFFDGRPPEVNPVEAFSAVLLYPDDETEIGEASTQPFVADYLLDLAEESSELAILLAEAGHVLIDNFDGALTSCINLVHPQSYTVLYHHPALAQKQAQALWNGAARNTRLDLAGKVKFLPVDTAAKAAYAQRHNVIYRFIPFSQFTEAGALSHSVTALTTALNRGGLAFVVGPPMLRRDLERSGLRLLKGQFVKELPAFRMHQTILPNARLKAELTLFHVTRD